MHPHERESVEMQWAQQYPTYGFGRAYQNSYTDGYYYGSIIDGKHIPFCLEQDYACQIDYKVRMSASIIILVVLAVLMLIGAIYALLLKPTTHKYRSRSDKNMGDMMNKRGDGLALARYVKEMNDDFYNEKEIQQEVVSINAGQVVRRDQGQQVEMVE